jgi:glycosyltransferase involved in cell wall biosynthesis
MMKKLLIIDQHQFGYLTDTYKYCVFLQDTYRITYVGWEYGIRRVDEGAVKVVYASRKLAKPFRLAGFLLQCIREIIKEQHDLVFIVYFRGCSVLRPFMRSSRSIADIRTGSCQLDPLHRRIEDRLMSFEVARFPHVTIISESLREKLKLDPARASVLPLGGERFALEAKTFEACRLLYVGTLQDRGIHLTVEGLTAFCLAGNEGVVESYDIVGSGPDNQEARLLETIARSPLRERIRFHGRIPNAELRPFFERANIGVAFIPEVDYYQPQPSTKVFEYLLSGMPVIATRTYENARVISKANGVLIPDTSEGFAEGLRQIVAARRTFDSETIRLSAGEFSWEAIVRRTLRPYLERVLQE